MFHFFIDKSLDRSSLHYILAFKSTYDSRAPQQGQQVLHCCGNWWLMEKWRRWMNSGAKPVILDGSIGEELLQRGHDFGSSTLWAGVLIYAPEQSLGKSRPEELKKLAREYLEAGSDIVSTATYQSTVDIVCSEFSLSSEKAKDVLRSATAILHETRVSFWEGLSADDKLRRRYPAIAASIGPLAAVVPNESEYKGRYEGVTFERFVQFHKSRIICLAVESLVKEPLCHPDVLAFETIPSGLEARAIASIMSESSLREIPYWISFQCCDDAHLANGSGLRDAVQSVLEACDSTSGNLIALGVNCVQPKVVPALLGIVKSTTSEFMTQSAEQPWQISTISYPNHGGVWTNGVCTMNDTTCNAPESWAQNILKSGAEIVGGCCGTGPVHIASLSQSRKTGRR